MEYRVGDSVVVTGRMHGHHFNLGSIVMIEALNGPNSYICKDEDGDSWYLSPTEFVPYTGQSTGQNNRSMLWALAGTYEEA